MIPQSGAHSERGQSLVEISIMVPVLLLLVLGVTDFARAFSYSLEIAGAVRAGAREAITSDTSDIGDAIRSEPNSAIPNTAAAWGDTAPGGINGNCTAAPGSQACGDPNGCPSSVFTSNGSYACFAIRTCTLTGGDSGTCSAYGSWGSRPVSTGPTIRGIMVLVVYKYRAMTPLVPQLPVVAAGLLELKQTMIADELYFS
jgi:hypothetical protein